MKFIILAALCCFVLVINAATVPLTEDEINSSSLTREKRSLLLAALGAAGLVGAGLVGAGVLGLAGAGIAGAKLGAKAGFAAGALTGSAARGFTGGSYYYGYAQPRDYEYRAMVRVQV